MNRKRRERKMISLILVLALIFSMNVTVLADKDSGEQTASALFLSGDGVSTGTSDNATDSGNELQGSDVINVECKMEIASENDYKVSRHDSRSIEKLLGEIGYNVFNTVSSGYTDDGYFMGDNVDGYESFKKQTRRYKKADASEEDDDGTDETGEFLGYERPFTFSSGDDLDRLLSSHSYSSKKRLEEYYSVDVSGGDLKIYIDPADLLSDNSSSVSGNPSESADDNASESSDDTSSGLVELTPEVMLRMDYEKEIKAFVFIDDYKLSFVRYEISEDPDDDSDWTANKIEHSYRLSFDDPYEIKIMLEPTTVRLQADLEDIPDPLNVPTSSTKSSIARKLLSYYKGLSFSPYGNVSDEEDTEYIRENIINNLQLRSSDCSFIYNEDQENPIKCTSMSADSVSGNTKNTAFDEMGSFYFWLSWEPVTVKTDDGSCFSLNSSSGSVVRLDTGTIESDAVVEVGGYTIRYPSHLPYIGKNYSKVLKGTNNIIYLISKNGVPITGEPPAIKSISIKMGKKYASSATVKKIKFADGTKIKTRGSMNIKVDDYFIDEHNVSSVIEYKKTPKITKTGDRRSVKGLRCNFSDITVSGAQLKVTKKPRNINKSSMRVAYYGESNATLEFMSPYSGTVYLSSVPGLSQNSTK